MTRAHLFLLSVGVALADLATKLLVHEHIAAGTRRTIVDGWFNIVHVHNYGVVFGAGAQIGTAAPWIVLGTTVIVAVVVLVMALRTPTAERPTAIGLHLVLGGAIGNITSRLALGYVIDFIDLYVRTAHREHHWPAFNLADVAICIGITILLVASVRAPRSTREALT